MREWLLRELRLTKDKEWEEWSYLKNRIKEFVIEYSKSDAKFRRLKKDTITKDIIILKRKLANGENVSVTINRLECKLKNIINSKLERVKVRSRARCIEEGEKPTKFFFSLNHANTKNNIIECLIDENNYRCFEHKDMLKIIESFYTGLFCLENTDKGAQRFIL